MNGLSVYEADLDELSVYEATLAVAKAKGMDYTVTSPLTGQKVELKRDVDFGVIPKTKQPSLFKAGTEKVCMAYGLMQRFTCESAIEKADGGDPLFFYRVRCELVKVARNGQEYLFASGMGSANTKEKRNGFNGAFDSANSTLKMAEKRALVDAALHVSGLSSMFSQDMENEGFTEKGYQEIAATQDENSRITPKQVKRLFAIASDHGLNAGEAKEKLAAAGYTSAKDVTQKMYDEVCALMRGEKTEEAEG